MSQPLVVLSPSEKLHQVADLLHQASQLLRDLSQPQPIPYDQEFFWTPDWQAKEQAVDQALKIGKYSDFPTVKDALAHLHQV